MVMMRKIKLRAWNKAERRWMNTGNLMMDIPHGYLWWQFAYDINPYGTQESEEVVLVQFIGLADKDGKEIYEGHILEDIHTGNVRRVLYQAPAFVLADSSGRFYWSYRADEYKIIGNIYDNPELIAQNQGSAKGVVGTSGITGVFDAFGGRTGRLVGWSVVKKDAKEGE